MGNQETDFNNDPETDFQAQQLDLALGRTERARLAGVVNTGQEWPSPQHVLGQFLEELAVTEPRRVAGTLLRDFGSVSAVLTASWSQLRRSVGSRLAGAINASRDLMRVALVEQVRKGPVMSSRREVVQLLQMLLGSRNRERLIALYVDTALHLLRVEQIAEGSIREAPVDIPKIIHVGLDVGAAGFLLVHNHPSGDATPSESDRRTMARISRVAADLDMHLVDALIVAGNEVRSVLSP